MKKLKVIISIGCTVFLLGAWGAKQAQVQAKPIAKQAAKPRVFAVQIQSGSLKRTTANLAKKFGWKLRWKVPNDYDWTGTVTLKGNNLPDILRQLIGNNFPVQANFYQGNKILVITPRALGSNLN